MRPYVYIAGPITGRKNLNRAAFNQAYRLAARTFPHCSVVVPHDLYRPSGAATLCPGLNWCLAMLRCLPVVEGASMVILLDDWETSRGAAREAAHAAAHGIPCALAFDIVLAEASA